MIRKNDGTTTRLRTVETMIPPITAMAIGARKDPPSPTPSALGSMPADMAIEVMTIGRARFWPASIIASTRSRPVRISSTAKSTSRMAFLVTMPISIRMPISTGIDSALLVRIRPAATPPMASGKENRMVKGWITSLNKRMRTVSTSISPINMALRKLSCISAWTSASPASSTCTPAGSSVSATISLNRFLAVSRATPIGRLAPIVAWRSRLKRLMVDGPWVMTMSATVFSGTETPLEVATRRLPIRSISARYTGSSCTRIGICRLSSEILARAASTSPMVATRTVSAICAVVTPSRAASSARGRICTSGRGRDPATLTLDSTLSAFSFGSRMATARSIAASSVEITL